MVIYRMTVLISKNFSDQLVSTFEFFRKGTYKLNVCVFFLAIYERK